MTNPKRPRGTQARGFALIPAARMATIASAGGRAAHQGGHAHQWTGAEARAAARLSVAVRTAPRWTSADGGVSLRVIASDALDCSQPGAMDARILALSKQPYIARQLRRISPQAARFALRPSGAWSEYQLRDHAQNLRRILWDACCDIRETYRG